MEGRHAEQICHPGIIDRIDGSRLYVRIESQSACGHCRAKSYCGMVESVDKIVEVTTSDADAYGPGQKVEVILQRSLGYKALLMGYMLPFLILLAGLFSIYLLTGKEGLSALLALLLMVPYYTLLYRYRDRLRSTFHFTVRPATGQAGHRPLG